MRGRNNFKRNVRGRSRRTRRSSALKRNMRGRSRRTRRPSALTRLASFSCVVMGCRGMNCETRHSQTSLKATQTITFDTKYVVTGGGYQIGEPLAVTGMSATPDPRTRIPTSWSCALSKPGRSSCVARACKIPPAAHCFPGNPGHAWMKCPHSTKEAGGESLLLTAPGYQLPRSSVKMSLAEVGIPAWEPKVRSTCPTAYGIALRHSRKRSIIHKGKFIGMERANKLMFTSSLSWLTEGPSRVLASYSCCRFRGFPCNLRGSRGVAGQDADSILAGLKVTGYVDFRDESVDRQKLTSKDVNCLWRKDAGKGVLDGDALLKQLTPAMRSVQTKANANPKGCAAMFKKKRIRVESLKVTMETLRRKIRTQASAAKRKVHHSIGELAGITTPSGKKFIKPAAQRQLQDAATAAVKSGPAFEEFRAAEQAYKEANQTLAAEQKGRYTDMGAADMNKKSPMHSDSGPGKCDSTFTRCCKCARKSGCVKCTGPGKYNCDANLFPNGHYAPPKYPASCTKGYGIIVTDPYLSTGYCQKIPAASGQCTEACHPKTLHDVHTRLACSKVCTISVTDENYGTSQLCHMGKVVSCECKSFSQVTKKCSAWKCTSVKQGNPPLSACANGLLSF